MTFLAFTALQTHRLTAFIVIFSRDAIQPVMKQVRHCKYWAFV